MNSRYFSIFSPLDFMLTRSTCFPWSVLACSRQPSALAARLCMAALHRGGPRAPRRRAVMMRAAAPGRTPVARCRFVTSRPRPTPHPPFPAAAVRLSRATWHAASRPNPWPGLATGLILPHCTVRTWRPAKLVRVPTDFVLGSFWLGWCSPSTIPFRTRFAHVQVRSMWPDHPFCPDFPFECARHRIEQSAPPHRSNWLCGVDDFRSDGSHRLRGIRAFVNDEMSVTHRRTDRRTDTVKLLS